MSTKQKARIQKKQAKAAKHTRPPDGAGDLSQVIPEDAVKIGKTPTLSIHFDQVFSLHRLPSVVTPSTIILYWPSLSDAKKETVADPVSFPTAMLGFQ